MAITKANLLAALKEWIKASTETVASVRMALAIAEALKWLSEREKWSCLHVLDAEETLAAAATSIAWPANFREFDCIVLNDGTSDSYPLEKCTFDEIKRYRSSSSNSGEPDKFCSRGQKFELNKSCSQIFTAKVSYWRYHPDQADIIFGDEFKESLCYAVVGAYLDGKARHSKAVYYWTMAATKLPKKLKDVKLRKTRYKDL